MSDSLPRFVGDVIEELRGQRIWLLATWNVLYTIAKAALDRGLTEVFAPDSLVTTGGGAKGQVVPDDWEESGPTVRRRGPRSACLRDVGDHRAQTRCVSGAATTSSRGSCPSSRPR